MAKIQIKSEKITPFGGIFPIMALFNRYLGPVIDSTLGKRCALWGYQFSEIFQSAMSVFFCGGSCIEDVASHPYPNGITDELLLQHVPVPYYFF